MPAYAMIDEPLPGSTKVAAVKAPGLQLLESPFQVWLALNWWPISWATKSTANASPTGLACPVQALALVLPPDAPLAANPPLPPPSTMCPMS